MGEVQPDVPAARAEPNGWLSLGEASRMLGINPGTLRRWADRGQVSSFTTPGGHRRFPSSAISGLIPAGRERRPHLATLGTSGDWMARAYRRALASGSGARASWLTDLDNEQRRLFRERGRRISECLLAHLDADAPAPAVASLHAAAELAADYGAETARLGASLAEAVEAFLRFRAPFVDELAATARRRGLDTREATGLLVDAASALDKLVLAFIEGWQQA